jgi:fructose transport system substrate-binding protein
MSSLRRSPPRRAERLAALGGAALLALTLTACADAEEPVTIGLITKQETNPFWVTMRDVAQDTADRNDVELLTATGTSDTDVQSQLAALESMTAAGATGILIAPTDSAALVPAIERARAAGVVVIAVDTPTDPESAVDALFATDNFRAGELVGRYAEAEAAERGIEPRVALLDLAPGIRSGELRREGFLQGFGIPADGPQPVAVDTEGDRELARAGMERLLANDPGINVVYTVNEPAAFGAIEALKAAGRSMDDVIVVSVDGGCEAIKNGVRSGDIDATAQQFPQNMAREGVLALAGAGRGEPVPSGYLDTGVQLITGDPAPGVEARDVAYGVRNCWGD